MSKKNKLDFNFRIIKKFYSKKNKVYKGIYEKNNIKIECVIKDYGLKTCKKYNEMFWLSALYDEGVKVPKIYNIQENILIIEYISGNLLIDVLEKYELEKNCNYIVMCNEIINWFSEFYNSTHKITGSKYILFDVNLRNFILSQKLYAIDFEDCKKGDYEQDIGRLCAFILTYESKFTSWKITFTKVLFDLFINKFLLDYDLVKRYILDELKEIEKRRKIFILDKQKDIIINKW